jgi:hypothetical protein
MQYCSCRFSLSRCDTNRTEITALYISMQACYNDYAMNCQAALDLLLARSTLTTLVSCAHACFEAGSGCPSITASYFTLHHSLVIPSKHAILHQPQITEQLIAAPWLTRSR